MFLGLYMVIYMLKSRTHGNTKSTKQKTINNARASIKKRKRQQRYIFN